MKRIEVDALSEPNTNDKAEMHISSFIVHCKPNHFSDVSRALTFVESAEVHAEDPAGKFVVVVEGNTGKRVMDVIEQVGKIPGVFNTAMVYQQTLLENEANESEDVFGLDCSERVEPDPLEQPLH